MAACASQGDNYAGELKEIAAQVNTKCPQMLDSETRLDGIEVQGSNTLVHIYTLVHLKVADVDTAEFKNAVWPGLLSDLKISRYRNKLKEHNTTVKYLFKDNTNQPICTVEITPQDYK